MNESKKNNKKAIHFSRADDKTSAWGMQHLHRIIIKTVCKDNISENGERFKTSIGTIQQVNGIKI